jgi:hypothetical protein
LDWISQLGREPATKLGKQLAPVLAAPAAKRLRPTAPPYVPLPPGRCVLLPDELGKLISRDRAILRRSSWEQLVTSRRARGDFSSLDKLDHPVRRLLRQYKARGAPVVLSTPAWTDNRKEAALVRGAHRSASQHIEFCAPN